METSARNSLGSLSQTPSTWQMEPVFTLLFGSHSDAGRDCPASDGETPHNGPGSLLRSLPDPIPTVSFIFILATSQGRCLTARVTASRSGVLFPEAAVATRRWSRSRSGSKRKRRSRGSARRAGVAGGRPQGRRMAPTHLDSLSRMLSPIFRLTW